MTHDLIVGRKGKRIGWFRVFGVGLHWKDLRMHRLLWSERHGLTRPHIDLGHWRIGITTRSRP